MRRLNVLVFVYCCTALAARGQTAALTQAESLLIGPGDELKVQVFDTPDLDETARVTDDGQLPLIFGGSVRVISMTPVQAARAIEQVLTENHVMLHPQVLVTVMQFATQTVTVFGQVTRPGSYTITAPRSLLDLISLAGGMTELADRHVTIERKNGGKPETSFVGNESAELLRQGTLVYPGDRVIVPKAGIVYILGDVGRPGGYPMTNNESQLSVLQAVALAGGTPSSAVPNHARLIRHTPDGRYQESTLLLSDMQKGKIGDLSLQPSDIVYVPYSYLRGNAAIGATALIASVASALVYAH